MAELCRELGYPSSGVAVAARLARFAGQEDHVVVVAADDAGEPVGWIHAFVAHRVESDPFVELGGMVVAEVHRGQGIGKRLLHEVEEWAKARQVKTIRVRSNVVRERAHRFYIRAGYRSSKTSHVFQKSLP